MCYVQYGIALLEHGRKLESVIKLPTEAASALSILLPLDLAA